MSTQHTFGEVALCGDILKIHFVSGHHNRQEIVLFPRIMINVLESLFSLNRVAKGVIGEKHLLPHGFQREIEWNALVDIEATTGTR